jgi:hypothetical protein
VTVLALLFIPETNPHILLQRRAKKMRKESGDDRWHARSGVKETPMQLLLLSLYRPMKVYCTTSVSHSSFSFSVLSSCRSQCTLFNFFSNNSAIGIIFGYLYLLFTTYELSSIFSLTLGFQKFLVAYMAGRKEPSVYPT